MVGTVRAARPGRSRAIAAAAFAVGLAIAAGVTFGALGAIGSILRPGRGFVAGAAVFAGIAALADLSGLRVRPQLRFQVPEPWRRAMPLPQALFLYGLLLGTGLTTFVPAMAAWALLPLSLAVGFPGSVTVGLAFATGRALPVLALGDESALAERPGGLRMLRVLAAAALVLALVAGEARAATPIATPAGDPSADGTDLVWQKPGIGGFLLRNGGQTQLPGTDPAIGGGFIAWRAGDQVTISVLETLQPVLVQVIPGVEKLAVSNPWVAYRVRLPGGGEQLRAFSLNDPATTKTVTRAWARGRLGRPSLAGDLVLYHIAGPGGSALFSYDLTTGKRRQLRSSKVAQLLNPAKLGGKLLYVRIGRCSQELRLGSLTGQGIGRVLYKLPPLAGQDAGHEPGHTNQGEHVPCMPKPKPTARMLWTTALTETEAYLTVLRRAPGGRMTPSLLSISR